MISLGLNDTHDLMLVDAPDNKKTLAVFVGAEAVALHVKNRILQHFGEWFLNVESGVPWIQTVMNRGNKSKKNISLSEGLIKKTILDTPGVVRFIEPPEFIWNYSNTSAGRSLKILKICILVDCENSRQSVRVELSQ